MCIKDTRTELATWLCRYCIRPPFLSANGMWLPSPQLLHSKVLKIVSKTKDKEKNGRNLQNVLMAVITTVALREKRKLPLKDLIYSWSLLSYEKNFSS